MSAEQLIGLEAAQAELGTLYAAARGFAALHLRAETELLPHVTTLGSRLRRLLRAARLTQDEVDAAAREIVALRSQWQAELAQVRASDLYQEAVAALAADRQDTLAKLIPQVLAGVRPVHPTPALYFPISPSSGRRRPGTSPFLSAPECADRILRLLENGYEPEGSGTQWWERELASIDCADDPAGSDTPLSLCVAAADVRVAVFTGINEPSLQIFTPRLRAPMSIIVAAHATDEWWEAYEDSYHEFRDALQRELASRGHTSSLVET